MKHPGLWLDWATYAAALYACQHWHYSRSLPPPPLFKVGAWEDDKYIGAVVFGRGANNNLYSPYGISGIQGAELVRVALAKHIAPVTQIVAVAIRFLVKQNPGLRIIVSHADPAQGHHGGIYQGGNWIYTGDTAPDTAYVGPDGKRWHSRMIAASGRKKVYGKYRAVLRPDQCQAIALPGKHRYLMPLDAAMRKQILPLAKPYPKRVGSDPGDTAASPAEKGGSTPTPTLHLPEGAL